MPIDIRVCSFVMLFVHLKIGPKLISATEMREKKKHVEPLTVYRRGYKFAFDALFVKARRNTVKR